MPMYLQRPGETTLTEIGGISVVDASKEPATLKDINFYDYDGTLVHSYYLSDLPLAALPAPPDHSGDRVPLTFQEWNYSLTDINAATDKLDVGATYVPTDGKTHIILEFGFGTNYAVDFRFSSTSGGTIDWGDGNTSTLSTGSSTNTHTYAIGGSYHVAIDAMDLGFQSYALNGGGSGRRSAFAKEMYFGDYVTSIDTNAFSSCHGLQSVVIPNTVTSISTSAFSSCYGLQSVVIPNTVTSIDTSAFNYCYGLQSVVIPNTVTSISSTAFSSCYGLQSVVIPNTVTSISSTAFSSCYGLQSVVIPNTVTSISSTAFRYCYGLQSVKLLSSTPPTLTNVNAFSDNHASRKFYVPAGSLAAYQAATNWSTYAAQMEEY